MGFGQQESGAKSRNPLNSRIIPPFSCFFCLDFSFNLVLIDAATVNNLFFIPSPPFQKEKSCIK